jgi:hypothetical protein
MPINPVALIAGTLSFSAALAWNKAISDTLTKLTNSNSSVMQAVVITIIIIIVVYIINVGLNLYTNVTNEPLKDSIIKAGGGVDAKVKLWNK